MLDLDALAESLAGVKRDGRVVGDEARRQVTDVIHARVRVLMEREGISRNDALTRLLEVYRQTS